ncbi:hypothetical protein Nepgr_028803 [Nepenthes gracilis]|uniref:Uncharacterized protein n=1 Tax=Nepenthes gracilis TaxID=150966 RepID=A0AAD3TB23_NEPGR|nr:hypothetical protein Nepgr_028803 [Nepenthes gracilis]
MRNVFKSTVSDPMDHLLVDCSADPTNSIEAESANFEMETEPKSLAGDEEVEMLCNDLPTELFLTENGRDVDNGPLMNEEQPVKAKQPGKDNHKSTRRSFLEKQ